MLDCKCCLDFRSGWKLMSSCEGEGALFWFYSGINNIYHIGAHTLSKIWLWAHPTHFWKHQEENGRLTVHTVVLTLFSITGRRSHSRINSILLIIICIIETSKEYLSYFAHTLIQKFILTSTPHSGSRNFCHLHFKHNILHNTIKSLILANDCDVKCSKEIRTYIYTYLLLRVYFIKNPSSV